MTTEHWQESTPEQKAIVAQVLGVEVATLELVVSQRFPWTWTMLIDRLAERQLEGATEQELADLNDAVSAKMHQLLAPDPGFDRAASQVLAERLNAEGVDSDDLDCTVMDHPEGRDRGGHVPLYREGAGAAYYQSDDDQGERWHPF